MRLGGLVLYVLGYAYLLWILFLAVMALKHASDNKRLNRTAQVIALPAVLVAVMLDIAFNVAASLIFLEPPRELTFSQRMGRYKAGDGWRTPVARWVCGTLLDPFQIGGHCHG